MRGKRKLQSRRADSESFYLKREGNTPEDLTFPRYHLERAKVIRSNQTKFPDIKIASLANTSCSATPNLKFPIPLSFSNRSSMIRFHVDPHAGIERLCLCAHGSAKFE
jgi:hypothetical protein